MITVIAIVLAVVLSDSKCFSLLVHCGLRSAATINTAANSTLHFLWRG